MLIGLIPANLFALSNATDCSKGRQLFINHCARCHGMQGGGGTGPNLQRPTLVRAPDDETLASIIENGILGTGMPGSWMLGPAEINEVIVHVRHLGETVEEPITGNAVLGKTLFEQKGACITCHIVQGEGRSQGPEITSIGLQRGTPYLPDLNDYTLKSAFGGPNNDESTSLNFTAQPFEEDPTMGCFIVPPSGGGLENLIIFINTFKTSL